MNKVAKPRQKPVRLVNVLSLLYLAYEAGFAIYRFWALFSLSFR